MGAAGDTHVYTPVAPGAADGRATRANRNVAAACDE